MSTKFSPKTTARIVARLEVGLSFADAARATGTNVATAKGWLRRGRLEESGPYTEFAAEVAEARESAEGVGGLMDADELARVTSTQARAGSVAAMRLRWAQLQGESGGNPDDPDEDQLGFTVPG